MRFGVFDHLDDSGLPLTQHFEERLKLIEAYDRAGFYGYHLAEHHNTPLGYAPSPGIFLSAVAQRTNRLRFGPMVYLLPLYHPLRLIDEICMLDQMSGGRFLYGVERVLMVRKPVQKPYPELWYGTSRPDSIPWAAEHRAHIVTLRDTTQARAIIDLYKTEWRKHGRSEAELPLRGITRHIVVAESEAVARDIARRAYRPWRRHMELLWAK